MWDDTKPDPMTAHEYELFYSGAQKAVCITLERQWVYQYVFVLFYKKSPHGEWEPVGYLDKLLLGEAGAKLQWRHYWTPKRL